MQFVKIFLILAFTVSINANNPVVVNDFNILNSSDLSFEIEEEKKIEESSNIDPDLGFDIRKYAKIVESRESGGDPNVVSKSRLYIGLYQFGDLALKEAGVRNVSVQKFIRNPSIFPADAQLQALKMLALANSAYLETEIQRFDGKRIHGYLITKAGLLGACHHVGFKRVKAFLYTGKVARDGNGVSMLTFLKKMDNL